jgi:hypothetical protein
MWHAIYHALIKELMLVSVVALQRHHFFAMQG